MNSNLMAAVTQPENFGEFTQILIDLINLIIPVVGALALVAFFWGLAKFIGSAGSEDAITEGKQLMLWGIVALVVMFSIWGIISFFTGSFGFAPFHFLPPKETIPVNFS